MDQIPTAECTRSYLFGLVWTWHLTTALLCFDFSYLIDLQRSTLSLKGTMYHGRYHTMQKPYSFFKTLWLRARHSANQINEIADQDPASFIHLVKRINEIASQWLKAQRWIFIRR